MSVLQLSAMSCVTISTPPPSPPVPSWWLLAECDADASNEHNALPPLVHTLHQEGSSVLSVAANDSLIFTGGQTMDIFVSRKRL